MSVAKLVFDIETVGEDFDSLDETTQKTLTRWIERSSTSDEEYQESLRSLKEELGFSPLTGEIVAIGMLDYEKDRGAVYYQSPGVKAEETEEGSFKYKPMNEKEMLESFWNGALKYQEFISYNGRGFDAPFLMIRSAIHGIRPTKDLMRGRYLYQQSADSKHIDLQDQLTFYGAFAKKGGLHMFSRAFGIESPKSGGVSGDQVGPMFRAKKYLEIAKYNTGDLIATKKLYEEWEKYLSF